MKNVTASEIARTLDVAGAQAMYDASARKLVSQKAVLAYILKSTMDEFASVPVKQIAEELIEGSPRISEAAVHQDSPDAAQGDAPEERARLSGSDQVRGVAGEDVSIREGTVRYDIRFAARVPGDGERIEIIVNIEIQNRDTPGYPIPKRGIYYGARLISAQRGIIFKDQEYGKIKKVVSIWICESTSISRSDAINEYRFLEKRRRGTYQEDERNYDLMRVIVMRLGARGENSEDDAIRLLSKIFSVERTAEDKKVVLSEEFHIDVTEKISQEVSRMCNLSTGILDRGRAEGRAEGRLEGILETLFGLVEDGILSVEAAAQRAGMEPSVFEEKYKEYCKFV